LGFNFSLSSPGPVTRYFQQMIPIYVIGPTIPTSVLQQITPISALQSRTPISKVGLWAFIPPFLIEQ
jgi:hypothetical protein